MDLNFDVPSDEEAEESFFADCFREPATLAEAHSPSSPSAPNPAPDDIASLCNFACFVFVFTVGFVPGIYVMSFLALKLNGYPIFYLLIFTPNCVPCAVMPEPTWLLGYEALVEWLRS